MKNVKKNKLKQNNNKMQELIIQEIKRDEYEAQ